MSVIQVGHYSNMAKINLEKIELVNETEPFSKDPRPYNEAAKYYFTNKPLINSKEKASTLFQISREICEKYNDLFCVNCACYVPLGFGCRYCQSSYCNSCYKIYDIEKNYCPICYYI